MSLTDGKACQKIDEECTEVDTEEMCVSLKTKINIYDKLCFTLKNLFKQDKKATVDFFYLDMCHIVKDWTNCKNEEFRKKLRICQGLLHKIGIHATVAGISVSKVPDSENIMSCMMFPLFVNIRYYDAKCRNYKAAHIFKDIHQNAFVRLIKTCVEQPKSSAFELSKEDERFKRKMNTHAVLATKKRRLC